LKKRWKTKRPGQKGLNQFRFQVQKGSDRKLLKPNRQGGKRKGKADAAEWHASSSKDEEKQRSRKEIGGKRMMVKGTAKDFWMEAGKSGESKER